VDRDHGSALAAWDSMGRPRFPTREQIRVLHNAAQLPAPEERPFHSGEAIVLHLAPQALAVVEIVRR